MSVSPPASQRPSPPDAAARPGPDSPGCPRCAATLGPEPEECPDCGFSLDACAKLFTFDPPPLEFLMDPEGRIPATARAELAARRDLLRAALPQVDLSFCLVSLTEGQDARDFGFWLFNRAPGADASRAWHLLVTIDLTAGRIVLTPGYAIEPFLQRDGWNRALLSLAKHAAGNSWAQGLAAFLDRARRLLELAALRTAARSSTDSNPEPADS